MVERSRYSTVLSAALLAIVVFAVYWRVGGYGYISIDDQVYIIENEMIEHGLTFDAIRWAFYTSRDGNWFPLTWMSYMLDISLFGLESGRIHLVNVFYHALNAVLLFLLLRSMTGLAVRSFLVAALFAVHPLHVESVAWVSERKDVLSTMFLLLTMFSYHAYARKGERIPYYLLTLALFACGLMAKPMLVTMPVLLLLVDYWPLERLTKANAVRCLLEKIPFGCLALVSSWITYKVQKPRAVISYDESPLWLNLKNAMVSYVTYIKMTFVPVKLAIIYPFPPTVPVVKALAAAALLALISLAAIRFRQHRWLAAGWFWYLVALVPVIGIVRVGRQALADRYTYIPHIGLLVVVVWGGAALAERWQLKRQAVAVAMTAVLLVLATMTVKQTGYWRDTLTLFNRAVEVTEDNYMAHGALGEAYSNRGELEKARLHIERSLQINPRYIQSYINYGILLNKLNDRHGAARQFRKAIELNPNYGLSRYHLGLYLIRINDISGALEQYARLAELEPPLARGLLAELRTRPK